MRKFGLIGYPLSHSFSAGFFAEKFATEGITDCSYTSHAIDTIEKLPQLLDENPELEGLNVTIPYKKSVIAYLHAANEAVNKIGACNCIKISQGRLVGFNTDIIGFENSLSPNLTPGHTRALILGTGGSAVAVAFVLDKLGIEYAFVSRQKAGNNNVTYSELNERIIKAHTLIINTTPLGMFPSVDACPDIPYRFLTPEHYLFDLVYNPAETLFLRNGGQRGAITKNGSDMLVIQAEESWRIWNGG
jgi:shikimate dehydrogenase